MASASWPEPPAWALLSLVYLSDLFAAETDAAARSSPVAAAEAFVAENNTVSLAGALTPLGLLLICLPMTRGALPHSIGRLGIVIGTLGLASEVLRFAVQGLYAVYGPLLWAWFAVVGVALPRVPGDVRQPAAARGTVGGRR